jgi:hypothetical protein
MLEMGRYADRSYTVTVFRLLVDSILAEVMTCWMDTVSRPDSRVRLDCAANTYRES